LFFQTAERSLVNSPPLVANILIVGYVCIFSKSGSILFRCGAREFQPLLTLYAQITDRMLLIRQYCTQLFKHLA
jgi:hypothetical protein